MERFNYASNDTMHIGNTYLMSALFLISTCSGTAIVLFPGQYLWLFAVSLAFGSAAGLGLLLRTHSFKHISNINHLKKCLKAQYEGERTL
ncbi:hypothetical protein GC174_15185 [bacterium]|nr:hypothetical protein [bacterium]